MAEVSSQPVPSQRFFNDLDGSLYLLPADTIEGQRLNQQYLALQHAIGNRVILAPIILKDGDHVLDSATGTGVWALDLASQVPASVHITCTDISPHLFPKLSPVNAQFARHSVLDLPADWSQRFSLVHQNLLIWALRVDEWPRALSELFRVTKPGGWAQLCELDWPGVVPADGSCFKRIRDMNTELALTRGFDPACAAKLEQWFKEAGFVNVQAVRRSVPMGAQTGYGVHNATDPFVACFSSLRTHFLSQGMIASEREYDDLLDGMRKEWDEAADTHAPFFWVWGQRPLES
ncbi:S-adenosyl-L-methionine-dependent methyltransferase [Auricularia subglabra TFB-10046 SS5]|nr:S-adenosyl-L-methionine-dependent methyltransferase [Auricularia subglabra TFB-10046 SS5]